MPKKANNWRSYANLINVPEGTSGNFRIEHFYTEPGTTLDTANMRTAMMGGDRKKEITFPHRTRWHRLKEGENTWMTDLPIEQEQHRNHLVGFKGSVLVGGLGLGVMAALLAKKRDVRHITIVEKSSDVLRLVGSHVPRKAEVVEADLFEYLKTTRDRFHYAFYDIWASDSEYTFHNMVVPLRQLSTGIVDNNRIVCWNENVMRGQLYFALLSRIQLPTFGTALPHSTRYPSYEEQARAEGDIWVTWCRPFFQKALLEKWNYDRMMEKVVDYVRIYGYPQWEEFWNERH